MDLATQGISRKMDNWQLLSVGLMFANALIEVRGSLLLWLGGAT